jgi:rod shape-determining protein MreC
MIFEISAMVIYVKYNSFQKATFISSTNQVTGNIYARVNEFESYLNLQYDNERLARENAELRNQLKSSFYVDTLAKHKVNDTVFKQQYEYTLAKVINNSVNKRDNYLTIDRGSKEGIAKGMGVICGEGVVGVVLYVSDHLALVQSLLHKDTRLSAMLADNKAIGSIIWGDNLDPHRAQFINVSNNIKPHIGEQVVTSDYSLFPAGIPIGKVVDLHTKSGGFFLNMEVGLSVDFSKLQYVNVVSNRFAKEQAGLEALRKKDE